MWHLSTQKFRRQIFLSLYLLGGQHHGGYMRGRQKGQHCHLLRVRLGRWDTTEAENDTFCWPVGCGGQALIPTGPLSSVPGTGSLIGREVTSRRGQKSSWVFKELQLVEKTEDKSTEAGMGRHAGCLSSPFSSLGSNAPFLGIPPEP